MSKHSQQLLVEHLQAMRVKLVERAESVFSGDRQWYLGLCVANAAVLNLHCGHVEINLNPQGEAVTSMIEALPEFRAKGDRDYMFHVYVKDDGAKAGHERRLEILDGWIADAQRKVRAAVFRGAIDRANNAGRCFFMCEGIKYAAEELTGYTYDTGDIAAQCMSTLRKYKPCNLDEGDAWFDMKDSTKRLRIAILNLCLTDVLRHGE